LLSGGTLGLFTGMSLVTIVEILFVLASTAMEIGALLFGRRPRRADKREPKSSTQYL
jgi:hypothetical protein